MPFLPGREKPAGSGRKPGRPKGSVNIRNQAARDIIERLNCDPLESLLRIAKRKTTPLDLKIDCLKAAVKYCHPALTTTQVNGRVDVNADTTAKIKAVITSDPALADMAEQLALAIATSNDAPVIDIAPEPLQIPGPVSAEGS